MKIVWTDPAVEDLRELHSYIARDSAVYASEFIGRIISAAESVLSHSKVGLFPKRMTKMFVSFCINTIELSIA
jgi:plasmid stabilization system protein ParE